MNCDDVRGILIAPYKALEKMRRIEVKLHKLSPYKSSRLDKAGYSGTNQPGHDFVSDLVISSEKLVMQHKEAEAEYKQAVKAVRALFDQCENNLNAIQCSILRDRYITCDTWETISKLMPSCSVKQIRAEHKKALAVIDAMYSSQGGPDS